MTGMDDDRSPAHIYALSEDGVAELHVGGSQQCQRLGRFTQHSYPTEGQDGDPCACGETRRGVHPDGENPWTT